MKRIYLILLVPILLVASCRPQKDFSKEYLYFQDADSVKKVMVSFGEYKIHKDDILAISIASASMNQEQLLPFASVTKTEAGTMNAALPNYTVDVDGNIQMPLLGKLHLEGLDRKQAQTLIELKISDYVSKPSVSVAVKNFSVTVLGEVKAPGRHLMPNTNATLIDAIAIAGDLTAIGNRQEILLLRQNAQGEAEFNRLDLTKAASFMQSKYFQLAQNDVIYIPTIPLKVKEVLTNDITRARNISLIFASVGVLSAIISMINIITR